MTLFWTYIILLVMHIYYINSYLHICKVYVNQIHCTADLMNIFCATVTYWPTFFGSYSCWCISKYSEMLPSFIFSFLSHHLMIKISTYKPTNATQTRHAGTTSPIQGLCPSKSIDSLFCSPLSCSPLSCSPKGSWLPRQRRRFQRTLILCISAFITRK